MKEIDAVLIPVDELPRKITVTADMEGSFLSSLQSLVGGNLEALDVLTDGGLTLYVNEEGLFTCPPNRALYATEEMERAGYLSQLDYSSAVGIGDFYTVLCGAIVAVGTDPETGDDAPLTAPQIKRVLDYFMNVSGPGSGPLEVARIAHHLQPGKASLPGSYSPLLADYGTHDELIAVGVGYAFALVTQDEAKGIPLRETGTIVTVEGRDYSLMKGASYEDSRLIDRLLDSHKELRLSDFKKKDDKEGGSLGSEARDMRAAQEQMGAEGPGTPSPSQERH